MVLVADNEITAKCQWGSLSTMNLSKVSISKMSKSKFPPKVSKWSQLSFPRISENDTFESVKI